MSYCIRSVASALFLFTVACLVSSCEILEPDETFRDPNIEPARSGAFTIPELSQGRTVTGLLEFSLDPSLIQSPSDKILVFIDGKEAGSGYAEMLKARVMTQNFSAGPHTLTIAFYNKKGNNGLLNLTDEPYRSYSTQIVIDPTPPTPVTINPVVIRDKIAFVDWSQCNDKNFYSYTIWYNSYIGKRLIATIYDRTITSIADSLVPEIYGHSPDYYSVEVSNRARVAGSNADLLNYGTELKFDVDASGLAFDALYNSAFNEVYLKNGTTISAISASDHSVVKDLLSANPGFEVRAESFFLNPSGTRLYVLWYNSSIGGYTITVFNVNTFKRETDFNLGFIKQYNPPAVPCVISPAIDNNGRLYMPDPSSGALYILDAQSGAVIRKITTGDKLNTVKISPDGKCLYACYANGNENSKLQKFSITGDGLLKKEEILLGRSPRNLFISPNGEKLYVFYSQENYGEIISSGTMTIEKRLDFSKMDPDQMTPRAYYVTNDYMYVSFYGNQISKVVQYDINSFAARNTWKLFICPTKLFSTNGNKYLFTFANNGSGRPENWIISLK